MGSIKDTLRNLFQSGRPKRNIPVIDDPMKRQLTQDYRRSDDEPHVIRIDQRSAQGFPKKCSDFVAVAGISKSPQRDYATRSHLINRNVKYRSLQVGEVSDGFDR